jgi:hypothetical protein
MIISNALPGFKRFLCRAALSPIALNMLIRIAAALIHHDGRMSASQAAGAIRSDARHRAAIDRFLPDPHWSENWTVLIAVADLILRLETCHGGTWVFILDQTYCANLQTLMGKLSISQMSSRADILSAKRL